MTLLGTEAHNPFLSGLFPRICYLKARFECGGCEKAYKHICPVSPRCFMKISYWPMDLHSILDLSKRNIAINENG